MGVHWDTGGPLFNVLGYDFKQHRHSNNADLLKDISGMVNNIAIQIGRKEIDELKFITVTLHRIIC